MQKYDPKIKNEAKRLYCETFWTLKKIAAHFNGHPSLSVLGVWKKQKDADGKNWGDYKAEATAHHYAELSPEAMQRKILRRVQTMLQDDSIEDTKFADALSKMQKAISDLSDPRHQIPVMFQMLEDQVVFTREHFPELHTEAYKAMVLAFKNHLRGRIEA